MNFDQNTTHYYIIHPVLFQFSLRTYVKAIQTYLFYTKECRKICLHKVIYRTRIISNCNFRLYSQCLSMPSNFKRLLTMVFVKKNITLLRKESKIPIILIFCFWSFYKQSLRQHFVTKLTTTSGLVISTVGRTSNVTAVRLHRPSCFGNGIFFSKQTFIVRLG